MKLEDVNTFNITFKTTNEIYQYMMRWVNNFPNDIKVIITPEDIKLISDTILRDTDQLHKQDDMFKKLVSNVKKANKIKDEYAMKHNHKYLENE
jgi:hypothetical protein